MSVSEVHTRPVLHFPSMQVAEYLLNIGAVQLNVKDPFTWVSGIKSPIYCDNRIINSKVEVRSEIVKIFVDFIQKEFPDVEIIAGVATGGMTMGSLIADRLKLPFIYVRDAPKEHGLMKQVEGYFEEGNKVVLIEDHVSTGSSSMKAVEGLRNAKLEILSLISIMTYGFEKAYKLFRDEGVVYKSLCDLDAVLETAIKNKIISEDEKKAILNFRKAPAEWYASHTV